MNDRSPLLGVSACLIRDGAVLLARRGRPPFEGRHSLPGGRVEFGETLAAAITREIREETGIADVSLAFRRFHEAIDGGGGFHAVIAVFAGVLPAEVSVRAGDDAAGLGWYPVAAVAAMEAEGLTTPGLAAIVREMLDAIHPVAQIPQRNDDPTGARPMPC